MRFILADLYGTGGLVNKDTVAGGYGSRLTPFSFTTRVYCYLKKRFHDMPSIQMGYIAAILAEGGHEVVYTRDEIPDGDAAIVLSSLVDYRNECEWADAARKQGMRVGFVGLTASNLPELFAEHADFIVKGEPESAIRRIVLGSDLANIFESEPVTDLDSLPFPRWDLVQNGHRQRFHFPFHHRPYGGGVPLLASRSCPEHCIYCPHRVLAGYRTRSAGSIVEELAYLFRYYKRPYVIFRDPQFNAERKRCTDICDQVLSLGLKIRFECETRIDRIDIELLRLMHRAGLRFLTFGVESVCQDILRKAGRRPIDEDHQYHILEECRRLGITTAGHFLLGFPEDTWESIGATIEFAIDLSPTFAQFKILTPYPGTLFLKKCADMIAETDWERFDGYHPTLRLPNLTSDELLYLLGSAYARFYIRPTYPATYMHINGGRIFRWVKKMDEWVSAYHRRLEYKAMRKAVIP